MTTSTVTTVGNPPILTYTRLPNEDISSGVAGCYTNDISRADTSVPVRREEAITYISVEDLKRLQEMLIARALKQGDGGDAYWPIQKDLQQGSLFGPTHEMSCPACGGENLHQVAVVSTEPAFERITIAYLCERCPAEPHLHLTQHKGASGIFWDGEMLLKDFGVYQEVVEQLDARRIELQQRLANQLK